MIGHAKIAWKVWRAQWLSKERLDALRSRRLAATVANAARLPFYRELWNGIDTDAITTPGDLMALPVMSKSDFRSRLDEIIAPGYDENNAHVAYTSGSMGAIMRLVHDRPGYRYYSAAWIRAHMAYGLAPHHRMAYFRYEPVAAGVTAKLGLFRDAHVPFGDSAEEIMTRLRQIRPHVLGGYPSYLAELISMVPHDQLRELGVRWVYAGAEMMPPQLARQLERIFECPLIDMYGTTEFENVAFQCVHGSRHISDDNMILEVLDASGNPAGPGEVGDIVITGIRNEAMPLVRYHIGDRGAWSDQPCACGRGFTVLSQLEGRSTEAVVTPSGRRYTMILLSYPRLIHIDTLFQFQVVQEAVDRLTLNLVCAPGTETETVEASVKALSEVFDEPMTITPRVVEAIPRGAGGKVKAIVPLTTG